MPRSNLDIVAIGDAIVDVIATCDDEFLDARGLHKNSMRLLDGREADELYAAMGPGQQTSGGSAANTMAGVAALGGRAGFIGQIADDQLGEIFAHDMHSLQVRFETPPLAGGPETGRCLILVTADGQRTMNTWPGASHELSPGSLDADMIRSASILYLEGYLWGPDKPRQTMLEAARIAHRAERDVAFTLSESVCIPGRREGIQQMIESGVVNLLFANEDEALMLTGHGGLDEALESLSSKVGTLIVTRGPAGAIGIEHGQRVEIPAAPAERVVDTTGAGDLFAAAFLTARCRDHGLERCLQAGATAAAEVIAHFGARPQADLAELVAL